MQKRSNMRAVESPVLIPYLSWMNAVNRSKRHFVRWRAMCLLHELDDTCISNYILDTSLRLQSSETTRSSFCAASGSCSALVLPGCPRPPLHAIPPSMIWVVDWRVGSNVMNIQLYSLNSPHVFDEAEKVHSILKWCFLNGYRAFWWFSFHEIKLKVISGEFFLESMNF
jgi:hypothetical protein